MIASTPPLHEYPSGILAIQIHQITGIEYEELSKDKDPNDGDEEGGGDLPSSYCTVVCHVSSVFTLHTFSNLVFPTRFGYSHFPTFTDSPSVDLESSKHL